MPALAVPVPDDRTEAQPARLGLELVGWTCLGLAGSAVMLLAGARLTGGHVRWWLNPRLSLSSGQDELLFYAAMVALTVGWLGLGRCARSQHIRPRTLWIVGGLWSLPLLLAAPVFSRDIYSYFGQGTLLHLGANPYTVAPTALSRLGHGQVLRAIDPFWQHTKSPYGPLFLEVVSGIAAVVGSHLVLGAQLVKLLGLVGLALLAVFVPRLARRQGADPTRATWLAVLNPLVLFALVLPGHNDLLMVGLMVAGVALAMEDHPLLGILICALAATVKLPALAAVIFIAVAWARSGSGREPLRRLGQAVASTLAVFVLVSLVTGVGFTWVTSTLFSSPAKVHLAITPATGLAWAVHALLNDVGVSTSFADLQSGFRALAGVITLLIVLDLLRRVRQPTLPRHLGWALVAFAWGGPAAWPWYFVWGLALLATTRSGRQRLLWTVALMVAGAFVVKPDGILAFSRQSGGYVVAFYALATGAAWCAWRLQTRRTPAGEPSGQPPQRSVLAEP
jgi:hypothetical protein